MDVTTLALAVDSTQVVTAASALDKLAASGARADTAATSLKRASDGTAKALSTQASGASKTALSFRTLAEAQEALGPRAAASLAKTTGELGATEAKADAAAAAMHRLGTEAQLAGAKATTALSGAAGGGGRVPPAGAAPATPSASPSPAQRPAAAPASNPAAPIVKGNQDIEKSARLAAFQQQQLGFQLNDFAVQVISGQSPITAFVQQGSQLAGTFGGAGNAFRAVTALITPMRIGLGLAGAAVVGLGLAFYEGAKQAREFADAVVLSGNYAGQTAEKFSATAKAIAASGQVSISSAREFGQALIATGQIGPQVFDRAVEAAARLGESTGATAADVAKDFASMGKDATKWAIDHNQALNFVSAAQVDQIKRFQEEGKAADAQGVIYDALNARLRQLEPNLGTIDRALRNTKNGWKEFWDAAMDIGRPQTIGDKLASIDRQLAAPPPAAFGGPAVTRPGLPVDATARGRLEDERTSLAKEQFRKGENALEKAADAERQKAAIAADTVVDGYLKRGKAASTYKQKLDELNRSFKAREEAGVAVSKADQAVARTQLQKDFAGPKGAGAGNEAQQVLDAQLEQRLKASRDALAIERDDMAFSQRYLQGVFQAGQISLRDFYAQKRQAISQGVAAEVAELEKERVAVQQHLEATKKASPKDASALVKDQTRLKEIDAEEAKLRAGGARETVLANQEEGASFKQLNEQVLTYRANLLQLQGDEEGAAKVRAQIAIEQARVLAVQSGGAISQKDLDSYAKATQQSNDLALSRNRLNATTQQLAIDEERIAFLQSKGSVGELAALTQLGAARAARLGQIQKEVELLEKQAKERPLDLQVNIDASRARLELEKLKADLDPLKEKFDGLFKDAGANLFGDLMNGTKPRDAIRNFGASISKEINATVGRDLSNAVFGKGGALGGTGGFFANLFGGKDRKGASLDTSSAEQSLVTLRTSGVDPATNALANLTQAADATAVSLRTVNGKDLPPAAGGSGTTGDFARFDRRSTGEAPAADDTAATGDFARFDRQAAITGEQATMNLFRSADNAAEANGRAAVSVLTLANAAVRGGGALNSLPSVVTAIIQAASSSSGGGGGLLGSVLGLVGGGASGGGAASAGASFTPEVGALFGWAKGGYTGDIAKDKVAGVVHGNEYVFNAVAVDAIGLPTLERMHKQASAGDAQGVAMTALQRMRGARELGGPVSAGGLYRVNERGPEVLETGGAQYLMMGSQGGDVRPTGAHGSPGDTYHLNVTVPMTPGASRETAMQYGATAGRHIEQSLRRQGKA